MPAGQEVHHLPARDEWSEWSLPMVLVTMPAKNGQAGSGTMSPCLTIGLCRMIQGVSKALDTSSPDGIYLLSCLLKSTPSFPQPSLVIPTTRTVLPLVSQKHSQRSLPRTQNSSRSRVHSTRTHIPFSQNPAYTVSTTNEHDDIQDDVQPQDCGLSGSNVCRSRQLTLDHEDAGPIWR